MAPQPWGTLCWICVTAAGMTNVPPAGLRVLSSEIMAVQVSGGVRMHVLLQLRQRAVAGRWFGFVVAVVVIEYPLTIVVVECPLNLGPRSLSMIPVLRWRYPSSSMPVTPEPSPLLLPYPLMIKEKNRNTMTFVRRYA